MHETNCVESDSPLAECAPPNTPNGTTWEGSACWNGKVTQCAQGYPSASAACDTGTLCFSGIDPANHYYETRCVESADSVVECTPPDTSGGTSWDGSTCWNGKLTFCLAGHPYGSQPCPAGTHCVTARCPEEPIFVSQCIEGSTPDGRCPNGDRGGFCDGDSAVDCFCGYVAKHTNCRPGACTTDPSVQCL
jgi:hypothetical protein